MGEVAHLLSAQEFLSWIDSEGGIFELIEHGVADEDVPPLIRQPWNELVALYKESCRPLAESITNLLEGALDK